MGTNAQAFIAYNGTLEDLELYVNGRTEFEKEFHVTKQFEYPKGYSKREAFERYLTDEEFFDEFEIRIRLNTPDMRQIAEEFIIWPGPKVLTLWSVYRAWAFEEDVKIDLYSKFRTLTKRYPRKEIGFRSLFRNVALSIARVLNQKIIIYSHDMGELSDDMGDKIDDGITIDELIQYLKEKSAFIPLSQLWGFGGVQKAFFETVE